MLYSLKRHGAVCQLQLNKTERKAKAFLSEIKIQNPLKRQGWGEKNIRTILENL